MVEVLEAEMKYVAYISLYTVLGLIIFVVLRFAAWTWSRTLIRLLE